MSQQILEIELRRLRERYQEQPGGRVFAPLADTCRKLGRLEEALQVCLTGLARHPDYSSAYVILGKIHLERGDDESAREAFERVLELDSQNLLALRHLARMDEDAGYLEEAVARWDQLVQLVPDRDTAEENLELLRARVRGPAVSPAPAPVMPVPGEGAFEAPAAEDSSDPAPPVPPEGVEDSSMPEPPSLEPSAAEAVVPADAEATESTSVTAEEPDREPEPQASRDDRDEIRVPASEIATMTLAEIYAEQGFKAKALEVYRQVRARSPHVPGIDDRIRAIELELERLSEPDVPRDVSLRDLETGSRFSGPDSTADEEPERDTTRAEESAGTSPGPPDSAEEDASPFGDPGRRTRDETGVESFPSPPLSAPDDAEARAEHERRDHFRKWLERMKVEGS